MKKEKTIFAAGCFWHIEDYFSKIKGVVNTRVGYTGGNFENPTYKDVCTGTTGHAEAVEIEFDTKRFEILKSLTSNALVMLRDMSPAGKIAYRSMDVAVIKGISEGDDKYATKMKERTLPYQKPWWKFW